MPCAPILKGSNGAASLLSDLLAGSIRSPIFCRKTIGLLFDELHPTVLRLASIRVI
jgi:hypothetical protein